MMARVVRLLILLCGIKGAGLRFVNLLFGSMLILPLFLVHLGFLNSSWFQVVSGHISGADVVAWPYSVGILCKFTDFLGILHWPMGSEDMGHFGVSFFGASHPF